MRLADIGAPNQKSFPLALLGGDRDLAREIQGRLQLAGLLDPSPDGQFGPISNWALRAFCERAGLPQDKGLTPAIADALLASSVTDVFPLQPEDDLAGRIIRGMQTKGYFITRHPRCINIVYVEGCDTAGQPNDNAPNRFNDIRTVISVNEAGKPALVGAWQATTEPGDFYTKPENWLDPNGPAHIALDQFKAWVVGTHMAGTNGAHEALVQRARIRVHRDANADFRRAGDKIFTLDSSINQHHGFNKANDQVGNTSAGCLVGRRIGEHQQFMDIVKQDDRYLASHAYMFMTTVMTFSDLG